MTGCLSADVGAALPGREWHGDDWWRWLVHTGVSVRERARGPARTPDSITLGAEARALPELETVVEAGPAAWGWDEDQCWTLARIAGLDLTLT